jgi:hypothetical protein
MDLGSCTRTHSVKVKNDFTVAMNNAVAAKDDNKVAELNRLKVEYEQAVSSLLMELHPGPTADANVDVDPSIRGRVRQED